MFKFLFIVTFLFILNCYTSAQQFKINKNVFPISTIDAEDTNYNDLASLDSIIGNRRIVALGELSHHDGSSFEAKTRIIKYLHEKKGFNVIAFESTFIGLHTGWNKFLEQRTGLDTLIVRTIYPHWSLTKECSSLFRYIKRTQNSIQPMILAGFDNQAAEDFIIKKEYWVDLLKYLSTSNVFPDRNLDTIKYFYFTSWDHLKESDTTKAKLSINSIVSILNILKNRNSSDNEEFYIQSLKSLEAYNKQFLTLIRSKYNHHLTGNYNEIRDAQMADNFYWLSHYMYPKEKIIIWAHNMHVKKDIDTSKYAKDNYISRPMGFILAKKYNLKDSIYTIGFTGYEDSAKDNVHPSPYALKRVRFQNKLFETKIHRLCQRWGFSYALVVGKNSESSYDLTEYKFRMRNFWNNTIGPSKIFQSYDSIFFIDKMKVSEYIPISRLNEFLN
jgi:erythromycin esterase-like protein